MDNNLTKKVKDWLDNPVDVVEGATLLLQLNRNRIFFSNVMNRPEKYREKVIYELNKHYQIRLDQKTVEDVVEMNRILIPQAEKLLNDFQPEVEDGITSEEKEDIQEKQAQFRGKRADHDTLPEEIKALWEKNGEIYFRIKEVFETLKQMHNAQPCDRYTYLKVLADLDSAYRSNLDRYDHYTGDAEPQSTNEEPADIAKKVNAARKYISDNKKKLTALKNSDPEKFNELLAKIQERVDVLKQAGSALADDTMAELEFLGIVL